MKYKPTTEFLNISKLVTQNLLPTRRNRKQVEVISETEEPVLSFAENAELIRFNEQSNIKTEIKHIDDVTLASL